MGQTMVEKIVSRQVGRPVQIGETIERLPITKLIFDDVLGPPAIENFMTDFGPLYEQAGKPSQVFDPKRVAEFTGPGVRSLSMDARTTMCNMAVEMSDRTDIIAFDDTLADFLKDRAEWPVAPIGSDPDATYAETYTVDLSSLEPTVAFPHKPANTTPISKLQEIIARSQSDPTPDFAPVDDDTITDAFLGSCTNKVMSGRKVHPDVNLIVIPASRKVYERAMDEGLLQVFVKAGANVESSNCGPCFGCHMGVMSGKSKMISTSNRNYKGRMGSPDARIFLASPATAIASAIEGRITDPRKYFE